MQPLHWHSKGANMDGFGEKKTQTQGSSAVQLNLAQHLPKLNMSDVTCQGTALMIAD